MNLIETPSAVVETDQLIVTGKPSMPVSTFASDVGFADKIVERFQGSIRYCYSEHSWLLFGDGVGWVRDESNIILQHVAEYARELYSYACEEAKSIGPDAGKRLMGAMASLGTVKRITNALELAKTDPSVVVPAELLDSDPYLVGVSNGVVNVQSGEFHPHRREHLITRRLGAFYDPDATAPTWIAFLEEVQPDPEIRAFLQRLVGYCLCGAIHEHILPFHIGTGANGKGTFLEHGILRLLGTYGSKVSDSLVYASERGSPPFLEIAQLFSIRFALGEENSEGGRLNEKFLKAASGGDKQKGRFHYGNFCEYWPSAKIHLVGNHRPRINGTDDGIWRRFLLIYWPVQIPAERRDPTLKDRIAAEMSGILNWALAGAREWASGGLRPPELCRVATQEFRRASDSLRDFLEETVVEDPNGTVTKEELFRAYQAFAQDSGIRHPMQKRSLGNALGHRGWTDSYSNRLKQRVWTGYRIKPTDEAFE